MPIQFALVAAVFTQEMQARRALEALRQAGFSYDQVGIALGHDPEFQNLQV